MRLQTKVVSLLIGNEPITIYGGKNHYNGIAMAVRAVVAQSGLHLSFYSMQIGVVRAKLTLTSPVVGNTPRSEARASDGAP